MRRHVFDLLVSLAGLAVVAILLVAGGLLMWGSGFASRNVHNQLAEQHIFFPAKGSSALASPKIGPYLNRFAGQQVLTGQQAKAYADHFIAVHLSEMPYGGVYAKISAAAQAKPSDTSLKELQQTSFQGTTLRGLLLTAYAFGFFATIGFWAGIAAFVAAVLMAVLVAFGFWHAKTVPADTELFARSG